MKQMLWFLVIVGVLLGGLSVTTLGQEKQILTPETPDERIMQMDPKLVDPSQLRLDSVKDLHITGTVQTVDLANWRLMIKGKSVTKQVSLSYDDVLQMNMFTKKSIMICPGFFVDYAEWTGIPIQAFLNRAGVENYEKITITTMDKYSASFSRKEIEENVIFLALKVNGVVLPPEHGFPARIVADGLFGGRWGKWVDTIEIE